MTDRFRASLARDGIFNVRDLGGIPAAGGMVVVPGRVLRADALQRVRGSADGLRERNVVRVLDLRDQRERDEDGVLQLEGVEVQHQPVLDPTFTWYSTDHLAKSELLAVRYRDILGAFGSRLTGSLTSIAEVVEQESGAVAYHCAVGKDRTGLVTALLLSVLGVDAADIARDYARSAAATAVQSQWLWSFGLPGGEITDEDMTVGVWSARPETMLSTLQWITTEFGDAHGYLRTQGIDDEVLDVLRSSLLVAAN